MADPATTPAPPVVEPPAAPKDRTWVILAHASAFAGLLVVAFGAVLGPLCVWLIRKDDDPEVDLHGKEALNFNLSFLIWGACAGALGFLLCLAWALPAAVMAVWLVLAVIGTVKAAEGVLYKYPFTIRFLG
jgi:uncharacterized Tic20 family protein